MPSKKPENQKSKSVKEKEQEVPASTLLVDDDKNNYDALHLLISKQKRTIEILHSELDFFKQRVLELEGEQFDDEEDDWQFDIQ